MSRRKELEREIELAQRRLTDAPEDTPKEVLNFWKKDLDSLLFELDNLYDDDENEFPD